MLITLLKTALKVIGLAKVLDLFWDLLESQLEKLAAKTTKTDFDDRLVKVLNELVHAVIEALKVVKNG